MPLSYRALELSGDQDLGDFVYFLERQGFPHRVTLEGGQQVVWVESEAAAEPLKQAFEQFLRGDLPVYEDERVGANQIRLNQLRRLIGQNPLVMTVILTNIICFPVTSTFIETGRPGAWLPLFTFNEFTLMGGQLRFADIGYTIEAGQWWRFVSPMLLHFGWLHLVFNLLWTWEFGRRIEIAFGQTWLLGLLLFSSLVANLCQFWMYGATLFGGMSGVVFGLVGFAMIWDKRRPGLSLGVSPGIYIFMLLYLVIGFTGAFDLLGLGSLANGAHLGGLIAGMALGEAAHRMVRTRL